MNINPKDVFIEEGEELLSKAEESLLILEVNPQDQEALNSIFRVMHTFKGSAGIVGFDYIQNFTHKFESFLDFAREHKIELTEESISILLEAKDFLSELIELIRKTGTDSQDDIRQKGKTILDEIDKLSYTDQENQQSKEIEEDKINFNNQNKDCAQKKELWHISLRFHENFFYTGMDPYSFISYLSKIGEITSINTIVNFKGSFESFDPQNCYLGFEIDFNTQFERKDIIDVFEFALDDCDVSVIPPYSKSEEYIKLVNNLPEDHEFIGEIIVESGRLTQKELEKSLEEQNILTPRKKIGEILDEKNKIGPDLINEALKKQATIRERKLSEQRSLRVDSEKLDRVINIVGELVTTTSGILQRSKNIQDPKLDEFSSNLQRLVNDLRDYSMELRMVPIDESFNKFKRLVRDLGKDFNKDIELEIIGGETELDKTFIEKINDPLIHIIRNSIDHGIESVSERQSLGKKPKGLIQIKAYNDSGSIVIEIMDDGKGLDRDKIGEKAVSMGLVQSYQHMSDLEVFAFMFEPGFSTAEKVTNISGRGVGMDVVKRNIEEIHGSVFIESQKGKYTKIKITLPLTLAIIDGFLIEVSKEKYVIPLGMVVECIYTEKSRLKSDRHYISLRGDILSFVDLRGIFELPLKGKVDSNIVIVEHSDFKLGLVVDQIHGEVQAVIKSLGPMYKDTQLFSGASILGDGSVALIIDVAKLIKIYKDSN